MTREKAINVLEDALSRAVFMDDIDVLKMAIDALREQEDPKAVLVEHYIKVPEPPRWISVEERLPDVERSYLTYTDRGSIHIDSFCIYPEHGTKFWVGGNGCVTHWMPLPEEPKEEVYA